MTSNKDKENGNSLVVKEKERTTNVRKNQTKEAHIHKAWGSRIKTVQWNFQIINGISYAHCQGSQQQC